MAIPLNFLDGVERYFEMGCESSVIMFLLDLL